MNQAKVKKIKITKETIQYLRTHEPADKRIARLFKEGRAKIITEILLTTNTKMQIMITCDGNSQHFNRVDFRLWDFIPSFQDWRPSKRGVNFSLTIWPELKKAFEEIESYKEKHQEEKRKVKRRRRYYKYLNELKEKGLVEAPDIIPLLVEKFPQLNKGTALEVVVKWAERDLVKK